jgi:hypothetical protein
MSYAMTVIERKGRSDGSIMLGTYLPFIWKHSTWRVKHTVGEFWPDLDIEKA